VIHELKKRPLFWLGAILCVIVMFPLGFAIACFMLFYDLKYGQGLKDFKKDGLYIPVKIGYHTFRFFVSATKSLKKTKREFKQGS